MIFHYLCPLEPLQCLLISCHSAIWASLGRRPYGASKTSDNLSDTLEQGVICVIVLSLSCTLESLREALEMFMPRPHLRLVSFKALKLLLS